MIARLAAAMIALSAAPAFAQDIAGSWKFQTGDIKPNLGCMLSGALTLKDAPETGMPMHCEMNVLYQCKQQPGYRILTRQPCEVTRKGKSIIIAGMSYEIIEENRAPSWGDKYYPEHFTLSLLRDGRTMSGRYAAKTTATFERVKDFAE
jgi:hypothetical protein